MSQPPPRHDTRTRPPGDRYGVPGTSYPTPNPDDFIIIEEVPIRTTSYQHLPYGTPHPTAPRALLVFQGPVKGNGIEKAVKRIYATVRQGEDAYNYSLTFESDLGFPAIVRTYQVLREDYDPKPDYWPDPEFTSAVLTREQMKMLDDQPEMASLFVSVTMLFEVLPSQWKVTTRFDEQLGPVVVNKRYVRTDSANVGLAGANSITSFEPRVTRAADQSLEPRDTSSLVSVETQETWGSTQVRKGQQYEKRTGILMPFYERLLTFNQGSDPSQLNQPYTDITPTGPNQALERVWGQSVVNAALADIHISYPLFVNLERRLPDELISAIGLFNETKGVGGSTGTGTGDSSGSNFSISGNSSSTASSSISIIPDVPLAIRRPIADQVPATGHYFYLNGSTITQSDVTTKLGTLLGTTVNVLPAFMTEVHQIAIRGKQLSLTGRASVSESVFSNGSSTGNSQSKEEAFSYESGGSTKLITLPPTVHGDITIANDTKTSTLTAPAAAGFTGTGAFHTRSASSSQTATVVASIRPSFLPGTTPTAIPITGLYMTKMEVTSYDAENAAVYCEVVDMSYFALAPKALTYLYNKPPDTHYATGIAIELNAPMSYGGAPASYSVSPSLPTGITIDTSTGVISGTPAGGSILTTYTVTATNATGSTTTTIDILIDA